MSHLHHSLCFLLSLAVKPTVIDVGIYVNSIGPVSSIDMVSYSSPSSHTHTHTLVHCSTLVSSYMNAVITHAVFGGHVGQRTCSCAEGSQARQVRTLCSGPADQLGLSK